MTTSRKIEANRSNSRKSTGPKTQGGKSASARNARKHGAAARLVSEEVLAWYRTIFENPQTPLPGLSATVSEKAAVAFAEAEVRMKMCDDAERAAIQELVTLKETGGISEELNQIGLPPSTVKNGQMLADRLDRMNEEVALRRCRLAKRYRREAETKREAAFALWRKDKIPETKPKAPLGCDRHQN